MDNQEQRQPRWRLPWGQLEAHQWVRAVSQGSTGMKDAALLNRLQLRADETGILHVGCAYGTFAVAAYRVLSSLTPNPADIVGIDHCTPMLDLANRVLDDEATRNPAVRNTVRFRHMDAIGFGSQAYVDAIQALFPRGISTIVATNILDDLENPVTRYLVHQLTALLARGGRMVLRARYQPVCWGTAHFVDSSAIPPYLVGVINLTPETFMRDAEEQARHYCELIPGIRTGGTRVAIADLQCEWMGDIWDSFIRCTSPRIPRGVPVNDEAWFEPNRHRFYNIADPRLRCGNSAPAYCRESATAIAEHMPHPVENGWVQRESHDINQRANSDHGLWRLEMMLERWLGQLSGPRQPGDDPGAWRAARAVISRHTAEIVDPHTIAEWDRFYLTPASVLVIFRRA